MWANIFISLEGWSRPSKDNLPGVAINSVLGGYNGFLTLYSDNLQGVLGFMNGSLSGRSWSDVKTLAIYVIIGLFLALICIKSANALQLGDEMAKKLGINVNLSRIALSACFSIFGSGHSKCCRNDWICRTCCTTYCKDDSRFRL